MTPPVKITRAERNRRLRAGLFKKQRGLCHWCGEPMLFIAKPKPGRLPPDLCTLDHLFDRFHPRRTVPAQGEKRYVAACWRCNNERGRASQAAQPIERLWERSRAFPSDGRGAGV